MTGVYTGSTRKGLASGPAEASSQTSGGEPTESGRQARGARESLKPWPALIWLCVLSATFALVVTIALFDRTTLAGVSRLWLGSAVLCFVGSLTWWMSPRFRHGRFTLASYNVSQLFRGTLPLVLAASSFSALNYISDDFHRVVYFHLYYERLLSQSSWPVGVFVPLFVVGLLTWQLRETLRLTASGRILPDAVIDVASDSRSTLRAGSLALGLLLSTASLTTINVNFWRYWATADGWTTLGHYPFTLTDAMHVMEGGVAPYFISFPLLPASLVASFGLVGHNTLGGYLPIIMANTLLPLGVFLLCKEITRSAVLAFLVSAITASFPLLRNYTMDVGEADALLMSALVFAAYFRLRADRPEAGWASQLLAGSSGAIAAFTRPEGILYVGPMYASAALRRWRHGQFWASVAVLTLCLGLFVIVCVREFGQIWPGNHSGSMSIWNGLQTLEVAARSDIFSMYAMALGISPELLVVSILGALLLLAWSGFRMLTSAPHLTYMPVMALANAIMVFFVGPIPAEAAKFHDFFRHISFGFPLLAVTLGYGLNETLRELRAEWRNAARLVIYATLAMVVLAQISLLEGPVSPGNPTTSPVMTSDVHVTATQMIVMPYTLPTMEFRREGSRYIPDSPSYMAQYPDDVNRYYEATDIRRQGNSVEYFRSARSLFVTLLLLAAAGGLAGLILSWHRRRYGSARERYSK